MARLVRTAVASDIPTLLEMTNAAKMTIDIMPSTAFLLEQDGVIKAALGLDWSTGHCVAGPLVLAQDSRNCPFMVLRLVEAMETFLAKSGVPSYLFGINKSNTRWLRLVKRAGAVRYAKRGSRLWFKREVGTYGRNEG